MYHAWLLKLQADATVQMEDVSEVSLAISLGQSNQMSSIVQDNKEIMLPILGRRQSGGRYHHHYYYEFQTCPELHRQPLL